MKLSLKQCFWALIILPLTAGCLQACAPKHKDQPDCGFVQNVYGERISWKNNNLIPLYVDQSFPATMYPALQRAMDTWQRTLGYQVFKVAQYGYAGDGIPKQDNMNVIYWMSTWEANLASEQARTSVYWVGDQIREADIRIDAKNFTFYLDTAASARDVHLESLLIHELGHVLGLKHKDDEPSVMATYLSSDTPRTKITDADNQDVKCEY